MKIAVNCRLLVPNKMDGIGRFTYETLQRITQRHSAHQFILIFDRKIEEDTFQFSSNVTTVTIPPQARHPILWTIWFEFKLKHYLNKNGFDLFISPEGWIPAGLNCKSLGVIHDLNFEHFPENIIYSHRKYLQHYFPKYAKRADKVVTVSEYSKKDIAKTYGLTEADIAVVYNGANEVFKPLSKALQQEIRNSYSEGEEYFVFVGTLHPRKNLEHLFRAFDLFKKKSASKMKLLIVGNKKWWPSELEHIFQSLEYQQDIVFVGRLEDEQLANVLGSAKALTYLPYFEGFGVPILEAFQAEVAVITSDVTSMPEVANGAALLCGVKDVEAIATAMKELVENEVKREELIAKGRKRATDFSWDKTSDLLWESIKKLTD